MIHVLIPWYTNDKLYLLENLNNCFVVQPKVIGHASPLKKAHYLTPIEKIYNTGMPSIIPLTNSFGPLEYKIAYKYSGNMNMGFQDVLRERVFDKV